MSRDKEHRHRKDRDHRPASERPQSTDVADLEGGSAHATSRHQRDEEEEDLRFGKGPVGSDVNGRIIGVSVVGGGTRILIGLGKQQGVHVGMEGYIKDGDGMFADFQIDEVKDRTSYAIVDSTPDGIQSTDLKVVINPSSMPKSSAPKQDMKTRIIGVSIEGGRTKIMMGLGTRHGARWGMKGYVVGSGGRPLARFEVIEEHPGTCQAFVDATIDMLSGHHEIVLNPSH